MAITGPTGVTVVTPEELLAVLTPGSDFLSFLQQLQVFFQDGLGLAHEQALAEANRMMTTWQREGTVTVSGDTISPSTSPSLADVLADVPTTIPATAPTVPTAAIPDPDPTLPVPPAPPAPLPSGETPRTPFQQLLDAGSGYLQRGPLSQAGQFAGVLGDDPFFQSVSPMAQGGITSQFAPSAARFALQTAISPFTFQEGDEARSLGGDFQPQSFQDFIQGGQAQGFNTGQFQKAFAALSPFFGEGGFTPPRAEAGSDQLAALQFLSQQPIAENVISQFAQGQAAPIFRRFIEQNMQNAFAAFNLNPASQQPGGLFGQFLRSGIGGVGGNIGVNAW